MHKNFNHNRSVWILVFLLLIGGLAGSAAGNLLTPAVPWLKSIGSIGLKPATLDLHFVSVTFGFSMELNPLAVLGLIIGYIAYRRV